MVNRVTPPEAWEILQKVDKATLFDVRSTMEYEYVGHPVNAVHIPWQEAPDWAIDPDFTEKVRQSLLAMHGPDIEVEILPVMLICRSGKRSLAAANELARQGFRSVYNVEEGFEGDKDQKNQRNTTNGWRYHDLPWEQS